MRVPRTAAPENDRPIHLISAHTTRLLCVHAAYRMHPQGRKMAQVLSPSVSHPRKFTNTASRIAASSIAQVGVVQRSFHCHRSQSPSIHEGCFHGRRGHSRDGPERGSHQHPHLFCTQRTCVPGNPDGLCPSLCLRSRQRHETSRRGGVVSASLEGKSIAVEEVRRERGGQREAE